VLVWVFVIHTEIVRLFGWFVNDMTVGRWAGCGGGGKKGGIFEEFLREDKV
jgi:hypothetical protein